MVNAIASGKVIVVNRLAHPTGGNIDYMNSLGANIRRRINQLGTNQRKVAARAGVSHVLISKIISGKVKHTSRLADIAAALELSVEELLSGDFGFSYSLQSKGTPEDPGLQPYAHEISDSATAQAEQAWRQNLPMGQLDPWDSQTPLGDDEVELPLFREVELAAGSGRTQVQENHGAKLRFAKSTLRRKGIPPEHAACCFVSGDSMEPILPDGSTVAVDTSETHVTDGKMYAIDHGGLLRVKYLYRLPGGGLRIRSANQAEFPDEEITGPDLQDIRVIGRVFWYAVLL
jgi:phage repressor protein C with HTH and peptisase S24 domain/DNA-binding Xre family transcriptional regulator